MRGAWLFIVRSSCAKGRGEKASQLQLKCRSSVIDEKAHPKAPKPGSYHITSRKERSRQRERQMQGV